MRPRRPLRAFATAAVVLLAACGGGGDPIGTASNGSIRGTVTDNTGAMVANAGIALGGNGQTGRTTNSGADGAYTFTDVPPGVYTVAVTPPAGFSVAVAGSAPVTVTSGAQAQASAFVLSRAIVAGSVRGTITDSTGAKVANAAVALVGNGQGTRTTNTGADGVYTFAEVPPGAYMLVAVSPPSGFTLGAASKVPVTVASGVQADAAALILYRVSAAQASMADSVFVAGVRGHLEAATSAGKFSGAVLVTRNGKTLFEGAYGLADQDKHIPNTPQTQFRVGSMTKMMTAVATLQLVQAGKLSLHAPLGTYLPDYPNADVRTRVTIHHLLTHTGGTGDIFGPQFNANRLQLRNISDYIELYGTRGLQFLPGTQYTYSNYGFILLGAIIERVSGMSYDAYLAAKVLGPAQMTATGFLPEDSLVPGRAVPYTKQQGTGALASAVPLLPYRGTSAGGGYSTVGDFARFTAALLELRLLDAAHLDLALSGKVAIVPGGLQYAYGFIDRTVFGRRLGGHSGGNVGMSGQLDFEPNGRYLVVVLANLDPNTAQEVSNFILSTLPTTAGAGGGG